MFHNTHAQQAMLNLTNKTWFWTARSVARILQHCIRYLLIQKSRRSYLLEYSYATLVAEKREIRLCNIIPDPDGTTLRISLRVVRLKHYQGRYSCLSYAWGSADQSTQIFVDGRQHVATRNLSVILHRLRSFGIIKDIWIDALCINQNDSLEMSSQVGLMAEVYAGAREVYIGLEGPSTSSQQQPNPQLLPSTVTLRTAPVSPLDSSMILGEPRKRGAHKSKMTVTGCEDGHAPASMVLNALLAGRHLHQLTSWSSITSVKDLSAKNLESLRRLIESTWFTRAWTVQEVCLARKTVFLSATGSITWEEMTQAFVNYHQHRKQCCANVVDSLDPELRHWLYRTYAHIESINSTRRALAKGQHIVRSLLYYQPMSSSDPRDKYYAFRGLHTQSTKRSLPQPNYHKSKTEAFTELAMWLMEDQGCLFTLCIDLPDVSNVCPSWVPDWSVSTNNTINANYQRMRLDFLDTYNAAKGLPTDLVCLQANKLRLTGVKVDQVEIVADRIFELDSIESNREVLEGWYRLAFPSASGPIGTFNDIFAEIMLAGCLARPEQPVREARSHDLATWKALVCQMMNDPCAFHAPVMASHTAAVLNRRFFRTRNGYLGIGPSRTQTGDELWVLGGGAAPFIVHDTRLPTTAAEYRLIGHCYVHGIMQGEMALAENTQYCILV